MIEIQAAAYFLFHLFTLSALHINRRFFPHIHKNTLQ